MKCGNEYFRINQHWEFKSLTEDSPFSGLAKVIGVPAKTLTENKGLWVVNFSKKPNYESLSDKERETYRRELNLRLINLMITKIPNESKYCVSYGQLNGCYWTIPATSTQGTTKEGDKDYIARVSLSPNMDLALHEKVFLDFVKHI